MQSVCLSILSIKDVQRIICGVKSLERVILSVSVLDICCFESKLVSGQKVPSHGQSKPPKVWENDFIRKGMFAAWYCQRSTQPCQPQL